MRKGVSPVVAIVLLIAIAVIAAVAVWFWVSPLTGRPATAATTQKTVSIENCWVTSTGASLLMRNSGGLTIESTDSFDVYEFDTGNVVTDCTFSPTADIASGDAAMVTDASPCDEDTMPGGTTYFLRTTGYPDAPFTC